MVIKVKTSHGFIFEDLRIMWNGNLVKHKCYNLYLKMVVELKLKFRFFFTLSSQFLRCII